MDKAQDVEQALEHLRKAEVLIQRCMEGDEGLEKAHTLLEQAIDEVEAVDAET